MWTNLRERESLAHIIENTPLFFRIGVRLKAILVAGLYPNVLVAPPELTATRTMPPPLVVEGRPED